MKYPVLFPLFFAIFFLSCLPWEHLFHFWSEEDKEDAGVGGYHVLRRSPESPRCVKRCTLYRSTSSLHLSALLHHPNNTVLTSISARARHT